MRDFFAIFVRKKAPELPQISSTSEGTSQAGLELPRGPILAQKQSAIFGRLPTEVRLAIYTAALTDPQRLLHILHCIPGRGMLGQIGHWRCDDLHNPHPIWQHRCFGCWIEDGRRHYRQQRQVNSDLLSLLLTCRAIYVEATDVLYAQNHFSFRGARGVIEFHSLLRPPVWHAIRHIHISTLFLTPMDRWMECGLPPENYNEWRSACQALCSLEKLQVLTIEMIVWNQRDHNSIGINHDALVFIFTALMDLKAWIFQVELNIELPDAVENALGKVPFDIIHKKKPYDWALFRLH